MPLNLSRARAIPAEEALDTVLVATQCNGVYGAARSHDSRSAASRARSLSATMSVFVRHKRPRDLLEFD